MSEAPALDIQSKEATIGNINTRFQLSGADRVLAFDISVVAKCNSVGKDILTALRAPDLVRAVWDDNGEPTDTNTNVLKKIRHKVKNLKCDIGSAVTPVNRSFAETSMKGIEVSGYSGFGLELRFKIQTIVELDEAQDLLAIGLEENCHLNIQASQHEMDFGDNDD